MAPHADTLPEQLDQFLSKLLNDYLELDPGKRIAHVIVNGDTWSNIRDLKSARKVNKALLQYVGHHPEMLEKLKEELSSHIAGRKDQLDAIFAAFHAVDVVYHILEIELRCFPAFSLLNTLVAAIVKIGPSANYKLACALRTYIRQAVVPAETGEACIAKAAIALLAYVLMPAPSAQVLLELPPEQHAATRLLAIITELGSPVRESVLQAACEDEVVATFASLALLISINAVSKHADTTGVWYTVNENGTLPGVLSVVERSQIHDRALAYYDAWEISKENSFEVLTRRVRHAFQSTTPPHGVAERLVELCQSLLDQGWGHLVIELVLQTFTRHPGRILLTPDIQNILVEASQQDGTQDAMVTVMNFFTGGGSP